MSTWDQEARGCPSPPVRISPYDYWELPACPSAARCGPLTRLPRHGNGPGGEAGPGGQRWRTAVAWAPGGAYSLLIQGGDHVADGHDHGQQQACGAGMPVDRCADGQRAGLAPGALPARLGPAAREPSRGLSRAWFSLGSGPAVRVLPVTTVAPVQAAPCPAQGLHPPRSRPPARNSGQRRSESGRRDAASQNHPAANCPVGTGVPGDRRGHPCPAVTMSCFLEVGQGSHSRVDWPFLGSAGDCA